MTHEAAKRLPSPSLVLLLAALLVPSQALANGFALDIQGLTSNGTASAGAASARDPAGQFANPAVLASLDGTQLVLGGMLIAPRAPYTDDGSTLLEGAIPLPGANGDGGQTGAAPWAFASHRLSPRLAVGFAFTSTFGLATDYGRDEGFYGRYQGVESSISTLSFAPSIAWRISDQLAVGLSVAARRDASVQGQALDLGSICVAQAAGEGDPDPVGTCAGLGLSPGASDGYARFEGDGWGWTLAGGVTFEPAPGTTLGVSYRHESRSSLSGREKFDAAAQGFFGFTGGQDATMEFDLPDLATASLSHRLGPALELVAAVQLSLWSRFDTVTLEPDDPENGLTVESEQGYRNAWRASLGAVWTVRPGLDLLAGAAFEQSPITDRHRQASLPERDSFIAGLGAEARIWRGITLGAAYQRVQMLGTSEIDQAGGTGDRLVGSVKGSANLAIAQLGWKG